MLGLNVVLKKQVYSFTFFLYTLYLIQSISVEFALNYILSLQQKIY